MIARMTHLSWAMGVDRILSKWSRTVVTQLVTQRTRGRFGGSGTGL